MATTPTTDLVPVQTTVAAPPLIPNPNVGVLNASQVYAPQNVLSAVTNPVIKPDYSDPFKLYSQFMESPELVNTRNEISTIQNDILGVNQTLRSSLQGFKDSPISMNAIRGASVAATDKAALPLAALSENLNAKTAFYNTQLSDANNKYQIAQQERAQLQSLISQTGGKAGIKWTDSFEKATKKAQKYIDKQNEEIEKKAKKEKLRDMYFELTGNVAKKGMSTNELTEAVSRAGASKKAIENELQQLQLQKAKLDLRSAGSGGATGQLGTIVSNAQTALLASRGTDGKVDPGVYASWRAQYAQKAGNVADFDAQFGGLLSGAEQTKLGVQFGTATERNAAAKVANAATAANEMASSALQAIYDLEKTSGQGRAVGLMGWMSNIPGSAGADYRAKADQVKALITLPELQNLRGLGAMSDREFATLSKAASALDYNMSTKAFNKELQTIKKTLEDVTGKISKNPEYYNSGEADIDSILNSLK